jgi:UDP-glucose 4-epimerase
VTTPAGFAGRDLRWLVTGGCGFIGANLCRALGTHRPGDRIRVLDDFSTGSADALRAAVPTAEVVAHGQWRDTPEILRGDVRDPAAASGAVEGADVVVHLAANTGVPSSVADPRADCERNVLGTLTMLEAARAETVGAFVFASSGAPAGAAEPPVTEEVVPRPISPYGASKLAGEAYCSAYSAAYGVNAVALRFSNVYGPFSGHKGSVVAAFIRDALAGRPLTVFGDGEQTRDFVHVDDLALAILAVATSDASVAGEVFQVATGIETRISDLVDIVGDALASEGVDGVSVRHQDPRVGDMKRNFADISKIRARIGWSPRVELRDGVIETVRHAVAGSASTS